MDGWKIKISKQADKFIKTNNIDDSVLVKQVSLALSRFKGEDVNIKVKKLSGEWEGYYRIRIGKIRIICCFDFEQQEVLLEVIDFRGNAYK